LRRVGQPADTRSWTGRLRDGRPGGTRTGLSSEVWREFPALAVAVLSSLARDSGVSGEDLHYRARTDYPRVIRTSPTTKKPKAGGPPGISWPTGGTERHETTDGPPSPPPGRRRSVYDTTVLRPFGARDSSAITQRDPRAEEPGTGVAGTGEPGTEAADRADDLLAAILTTYWTLATGRTLPAGVSPRSLSEEELINF